MPVDKRQQMLMLQRKRGKLYQALRESLQTFQQMGIKADIHVPKGKDNIAYLLIDEESVAKYFGRKVKKRIAEIDKSAEIKTYYENDVLVVYCKCSAEYESSNVNSEVNKVKEELSKIGIKSEVIVTHDYYTKIYFMIDNNSVVNYYDRTVKDKIRSKNLKVEVTTYREDGVLVVRLRK